jgi:sensor histidine kinase regulating citrate/malate metabolism
MSELTQGVLICDTVGRILLYNRQAQRVLNKVQRPDGLDIRMKSG